MEVTSVHGDSDECVAVTCHCMVATFYFLSPLVKSVKNQTTMSIKRNTSYLEILYNFSCNFILAKLLEKPNLNFGLTEGLDGVRRWVRLGIVQLRHHGYPGSGPSTPDVTPLLPALFLISSTVVTTLLELFGLEEEEEMIGSP
jgi:hypothetical protein